MVRGYEIEKGKFIEITDDELERLAPEKSRDIDLQALCGTGRNSAAVLRAKLFSRQRVDRAKPIACSRKQWSRRAGPVSPHLLCVGKEYLLAIIAENGILRAETLRFSDEIRSPEEVGLPHPPKSANGKVRKLEQAIKKLSADEVPEMKDDAAKRLLELARKKQSRHKDVFETGAPSKGAEVIDIMASAAAQLGASPGANGTPVKGSSGQSTGGNPRWVCLEAGRETAAGKKAIGQLTRGNHNGLDLHVAREPLVQARLQYL